MNQKLGSESVRYPVLDLGGGHHWSYTRHMDLDSERVTCLNLEGANNIDVIGDATEPLPFQHSTFETVLCLNLLEHVSDATEMVAEMRRVLTDSGTVYLFVPFLHRIHGHPEDYYRYTESALRELFEDFGVVDVTPHAKGPVSAAAKFAVPLNVTQYTEYLTWRLSNAVDAVCARLGLYSEGTRECFPTAYLVRATV